ncbi:hypothetical protein IIU_06770 [Bacillus cereus VD133]|uniref:Uncharacterized protein n=1 Tax=Bacillus cereus VD133 TaxID=1053233 RepID=A0A9W5PJJ6_BACCE|nr:hypothetical protein IIU_06770 [Bacillus cereus VD133]
MLFMIIINKYFKVEVENSTLKEKRTQTDSLFLAYLQHGEY